MSVKRQIRRVVVFFRQGTNDEWTLKGPGVRCKIPELMYWLLADYNINQKLKPLQTGYSRELPSFVPRLDTVAPP